MLITKFSIKHSPRTSGRISLQWFVCFLLLTLFVHNSGYAEELETAEPSLRVALPDLSQMKSPSRDKFEQLSSFLREYWQIWSIDNNRKVSFVYLKSQQSQLALKDNLVDVIAISVIDRPNPNALLSIPYAKYKQSIFRKLVGNQGNGLQLGIHSDTQATLNYLSKHIEKTYFEDINTLIADYRNYDILYSTKPWLLKEMLKANELLQYFVESKDEAPEIYFHFATRSSDRNLLYDINNSLRNISNLQAQLWTNKYFSNTEKLSLTLGHYISNLSEEEKQFVIDNNLLTYPVTKDGFPPYVITRTFSNISERGLSIDITNLATDKTGLLFKPVYVDSIKESIDIIIAGQANVLILADKNKKYRNYLSHSSPYLTNRFNLVHRVDDFHINNFNDLSYESIAVVDELHSTHTIEKMLPFAKIKRYPSIQAAILAVANGNVSAFVGSPMVGSYTINQYQLSNLKSTPVTNLPINDGLGFATLKKNKSLIDLLNRTLNTVTDNQFDAIYAKWSNKAFNNNTNSQEEVATAYRKMGWALTITVCIAIIIFWIYYRQLSIRKIAQTKVEQALSIAEAARVEAEKSAQAKVNFLARMSHEIRTPMNGVLGMAESLTYTELNQSQQALLDTLKGSAKNLLSLLNDVLDFSKMDAGKLTLESVPVNIRMLTENVIDSFNHQYIENKDELSNKFKIDFHIDEHITHLYFCDPTRLTQVFNNLLSNAFKFTNEGKIEVIVSLKTSNIEKDCTYDTLHFSVKDSGIGIAKDRQSLLFKPFIQADSQITRKYGGTGLGLSISQEIISAMGGNILLESEEGLGSRFHFYLKFKQAKLEQKITNRRKIERSVSNPDAHRFDNIRVLVAEDNIVNVLVITAQLERLNIKADIAENGQVALDLHRAKPYDIILSDCHMPVLDGFELARILTKEKSATPLWMIAITADALSGAAEKCMQAGFNDFMAKPCPQEEVTNKLHHAYRQIIKTE